MGLFDLIKKEFKSVAAAKIDEINKKVEAAQHKITTTPIEALLKGKAAKVDKKSVKNISKQILAQRNSFIRNGFKEYEFIANSGCCEICAELNGQHFEVASLKIGVNAPPMHEGCRCSIAAYEDEKAYREWLNSF